MKQVKPSKLLVERATEIANVLAPQVDENSDNGSALAYILELPHVNQVDKEKYASLLVGAILSIKDGVELTEHAIDFSTVVVKKERVLSPEVRKARYEKACQKLAEKYGMGDNV